jgi:mitochondrial cardiolipin hydrolase
MDAILAHLKNSIEDQFFSKTEKKTLKSLLDEQVLSDHQLNLLRNKIYELANEKATPDNYRFILEWIRIANSALTPTPPLTSSDAFFSPGDACRNVIINQVQAATTQLKICVFTISDDLITNALLTAHKKGVRVQVLTDNDKSQDEGSDVDQIARVGIPVKIDNTPNHMHHKFMVVDQRTLLTGSYNWTRSAARYNHENILLTKEAGIVKSFSKEFEQLWNEMELYQ